MNYKEQFGERIRLRRIQLGMTQEELAERMGYKTKSSINKIEKGVSDVPQSTVVKFADVMNTTPSYLMGWDTIIDTEYGELLIEMKKLSPHDLQFVKDMVTRLSKGEK